MHLSVFTAALKGLADKLPKPEAIVVVSAHWLTNGTFVTCAKKPIQIYDFFGFPEELYRVKYQPGGSSPLAKLICDSYPSQISCDEGWGYDHASWAILKHMYPKAEVPVIELSLDLNKSSKYHYELGEQLSHLRRKGVLIIGSGNIVHNLRLMNHDANAEPYDWAIEFDKKIRDALLEQKKETLIDYRDLGKSAELSVPTTDHYLPMLYIAALQKKDESIEFVYEEIQHASVSMRCFQIG